MKNNPHGVVIGEWWKSKAKRNASIFRIIEFVFDKDRKAFLAFVEYPHSKKTIRRYINLLHFDKYKKIR